MLKLIQFLDKQAVWSSQDHNVPGYACRTIKHLYLLPNAIYLEFNCKEYDLASVSDSPQLFQDTIKQYYIPEIKLQLN